MIVTGGAPRGGQGTLLTTLPAGPENSKTDELSWQPRLATWVGSDTVEPLVQVMELLNCGGEQDGGAWVLVHVGRCPAAGSIEGGQHVGDACCKSSCPLNNAWLPAARAPAMLNGKEKHGMAVTLPWYTLTVMTCVWPGAHCTEVTVRPPSRNTYVKGALLQPRPSRLDNRLIVSPAVQVTDGDMQPAGGSLAEQAGPA